MCLSRAPHCSSRPNRLFACESGRCIYERSMCSDALRVGRAPVRAWLHDATAHMIMPHFAQLWEFKHTLRLDL